MNISSREVRGESHHSRASTFLFYLVDLLTELKSTGGWASTKCVPPWHLSIQGSTEARAEKSDCRRKVEARVHGLLGEDVSGGADYLSLLTSGGRVNFWLVALARTNVCGQLSESESCDRRDDGASDG